DQLASATEKQVTVQAVLQLLGAVEEEALFRLCDLVVDRDGAGALTFIEELSEQGQDLGRLVTDLLEHLRHLMLVQRMGEVPEPPTATPPPPRAQPPSLELEQLQEAWQRTIVPAVEERSVPAASVLREAHPAGLSADTLTVEFPATATFHRTIAEEPKNATLLEDALYEVTGRKLGIAFAEGEAGAEAAVESDEP